MEQMNIVIVGHVDHGKSTLIGRLLFDTHSLPDGKIEQIKEKCKKESKVFEYAFLIDALKDEQSQGITIDTARVFFNTKKRNYIIIDTPGHSDFLKNMVSGASRAEGAILVIDAKEGVAENSKRHGYLLSLLGVKQLIVCINKMDLVNYSEEVFNKIKKEYTEYLEKIGVKPLMVVPISAVEGDNIAAKQKLAWYKGLTLFESIDSFSKEKEIKDLPYRMPVQDVYKFTGSGDERRIVAGRIQTGSAKLGDEVIFFPSEKKAKIKTIERGPLTSGYSVGVTLDTQLFVKRGDLMCLANESRPKVGAVLNANIFWLGKNPLLEGKEYSLKVGTQKVKAKVIEIFRVVNSSTIEPLKKDHVDSNEVAEIKLECYTQIAYEYYATNQTLGRFVLIDEYDIVGGGIITHPLQPTLSKDRKAIAKERNIFWHHHNLTKTDREGLLNQKAKVIWLTGLSGSGKSTIANILQNKFFTDKKLTYILDADNIRHGLNSDLGFTENDRKENIRRIGEVSNLIIDCGVILIACFISPYEEDRQRIKALVGEKNFLEVYLRCPLEVCESRDPKGLYKKARAGEIKDFTGISAPYEEPINPDLIIDSEKTTAGEAAELILEKINEIMKSFES